MRQFLIGRSPKAALFVAAALYGAATGLAVADDAEVFFPSEIVTEEGGVRPNILFMIDTSGSMSNFDAYDQSRMDRAKDALNLLLDELSQDINVGLMRLSNEEGGPVLFPVSPIDELVANIDASLAFTDVFIASKGGNDEAQKDSEASATAVSPGSLVVGTIPAGVQTQVLTYRVDEVEDEAEEDTSNEEVDADDGSGSRQSVDLELIKDGGTTQLVGVKFDGFSPPAGATLQTAVLEFTCRNGGESADTDLDIKGHKNKNSNDFEDDDEDVSGRSRTTAKVNWDNVADCNNAGDVITSPDVKSIISEIMGVTGWVAGKPVTFIISSDGAGNSGTGGSTSQGPRTVWARNGNAASPGIWPRLVVTYTSGSAADPEKSRTVGLRFPNVQIPRGVVVTSAAIVLTSTNALNSEGIKVNISVEDSGDAAAYDTTGGSITGRTYSSLTTWTVPATTANGQQLTSPDLTALVNAVTGSSSWCGGNAMTFKFEPADPAGATSALRSFVGFATDAGLAAQLRLSYSSLDPVLETGCNHIPKTNTLSGSSTDAEESASFPGTVSLTSSTLELGINGSTAQQVGLRFPKVLVPQGATIRAARIEFYAKGTSSGAAALTIRGEATDDAAPFATTVGDLNTRKTTRSTSATVAWSPPDWTVDQGVYATADIRTIAQEIVNRAGWASGNDMAFIIDGTGTRKAYPVDASASRAARLILDVEGPLGRVRVRQYLKQLVADLSPVGYTPVPEVMYEAAQYYRGGTAYYGRTRGGGSTHTAGDSDEVDPRMRVSHPAAFDDSAGTPVYNRPAGCTSANLNADACKDETITGTTKYKSPLQDQTCIPANFVLLTDGIPNNTEVDSNGLASGLIGASCSPDSDNGEECGVDIAKFMFEKDQAPGFSGVQNIRTFTIGFNLPSQDFLKNVAAAGGGQFFATENAQDTLAAFRSIVGNILDIATTFVAPSVTVNTFNRLTHRNELYFALFRPQPETRWEGNLKRYKLAGSPVEIRDANDVSAVDPSTGFFRSTAKSFWSAAVDGDDVSKGGVVGRFPAVTTRTLYTYTGALSSMYAGGATAPTALTLSTSPTSSATALHEDNTALTKTLLGNAGMTDQERIDVLKFSRGLDVNDDDADANLTEARQSLGDPLHSEPLLITYGGTDAAPDITIYFGTNEGAIHAINAGTSDTDTNGGKETFAFVPQELLPNLTTYKQNNVGYVGRPYGVDGLISSLIVDPDGDLKILNADNTVQTNNKALIYAGMRLGGRQYYSLDVTNRSAPKLNWIIRGVDGAAAATDKYRELAYTWSRMTPAKIRLNGTIRQVVIFSGGYDLDQDGAAIAPVDNEGRAIYIADAFTGERLWWAGIDPDALADDPDLVVPEMTYSIPATPKAIDLNGDGLVDRLYVADMGGQLFRFILNNGNTGAATLGSVSKIAQLGGDGTVENARRFYSPPDVALIRENVVTPFLSVSLGSGYRGHPLSETTKDRFYVLRDPDVAVGAGTSFFATDVGMTPNLFDATDNAIASSDPDVAAAAQTALNDSKGFFIDLVNVIDGSLNGEKVLTESRTFGNSVLFATFEPGAKQAAATCQASLGLSRFYLFSVADGRPVQNLTGDSQPDRYKELAQGGLPPDPTILFPSVGGVLPKEALICVGPECFQAGLTIQTGKTYWIKQR